MKSYFLLIFYIFSLQKSFEAQELNATEAQELDATDVSMRRK
jgi:hypothetical protein